MLHKMHEDQQVTSVADVPEPELLRWLFLENPAGCALYEELDILRPATVRLKIGGNELGLLDGPGDVDVLILPGGCEGRAVAIECKCVKFSREMLATGQCTPNGLERLKKGAKQANLLVSAGFHRVFLLAAVKVDAASQAATNWVGKRLRGEQVKVVRDRLGSLQLSPWVGVVCLEIVQPVNRCIECAGSIGIEILRRGCPQVQTQFLTKKLRALPCGWLSDEH